MVAPPCIHNPTLIAWEVSSLRTQPLASCLPPGLPVEETDVLELPGPFRPGVSGQPPCASARPEFDQSGGELGGEEQVGQQVSVSGSIAADQTREQR